MSFLDPSAALTNAGSLLSRESQILASYDLEVSDAPADGYHSLSTVGSVKNANHEAFEIDYQGIAHAHIINGMGVTLGDSIIGLTALSAIKKRNPEIRLTIYRPNRAPEYVKQLYQLAAPIFGALVDLPVHADSLPDADLRIDVGNHLFWPNFSTMPMIDFFLWALGMEPGDVVSQDKSNDWLASIALPELQGEWKSKEYSLFCPTASTPVRSIPKAFHAEAVNKLWEKFHVPVLGFGRVDHEHYTDITRYSKNTADFITWVKNARFLATSDTAAVHIAAGFNVPTVAFFTSIPSEMRVRDYRQCTAIDLRVDEVAGIQASSRVSDLFVVERAFNLLKESDWASNALHVC
ncbi:glycosyltransferase family 9 protein [Paraburkholderia sp. EG286B]|uniref:glycosyltransferase family 9 protein n=1 Tax=Paraburkholderia sp. EG286B TaxID=3237011 RepID=UPI0034D27514